MVQFKKRYANNGGTVKYILAYNYNNGYANEKKKLKDKNNSGVTVYKQLYMLVIIACPLLLPFYLL